MKCQERGCVALCPGPPVQTQSLTPPPFLPFPRIWYCRPASPALPPISVPPPQAVQNAAFNTWMASLWTSTHRRRRRCGRACGPSRPTGGHRFPSRPRGATCPEAEHQFQLWQLRGRSDALVALLGHGVGCHPGHLQEIRCRKLARSMLRAHHVPTPGEQKHLSSSKWTGTGRGKTRLLTKKNKTGWPPQLTQSPNQNATETLKKKPPLN